jgi:uncharacterized protein YndB with AHSA1/START domain
MNHPISLAVDVAVRPARVFEILSTTEGQRAFWTADCDLSAGHARYGFPGSAVDVEADVTTEPQKLVRMRVTSGPRTSFLENSTWEWELSDSTAIENGTGVVSRHYGFGDHIRGGQWHGAADPEFDLARMAQTWAMILDRLSSYITSGSPQPYFPAPGG